jgi:ABC-type nitrate/sulfonate/bicarbonate transport system permease component
MQTNLVGRFHHRLLRSVGGAVLDIQRQRHRRAEAESDHHHLGAARSRIVAAHLADALPRTMPFFFASLKVSVTLAFVGTVISETVASNRGIGNVMMIASSNFDVPLVFAGLMILAFLGVALYAVFSFIESRITGWAHRKDEFAMG